MQVMHNNHNIMYNYIVNIIILCIKLIIITFLLFQFHDNWEFETQSGKLSFKLKIQKFESIYILKFWCYAGVEWHTL